ncbi:hypothetical protein [Herbaspirillum sp. YR522]|uniref:hypothetical protein n=1 Tax=Herbaspirillum sp. YR522 TaxID=1144342 RepID=UPI00026F76FC|nr:hypothetical protein [Herbaspirillum sp. YR522]EJM98520.1 hypothetical protein PMI40_03980 [Herbaspirillum sp. YR522]
MIGKYVRIVLVVLPALVLGGCVAVPYDPYYGAQPAYSTYPAYPGYGAYPVQPAYVAPYSSSFYFGYGGGWGHRGGHWRR